MTVSKIGKILTGQSCKLFLSLWSFQMFTGALFQIKLHLLSTILLSGFQSSLRNPLSKTVPGEFHGSGGQSKRNCLQERADFHRSRAWQIVLIFNAGQWRIYASEKLFQGDDLNGMPHIYHSNFIKNNVDFWSNKNTENNIQNNRRSFY